MAEQEQEQKEMGLDLDARKVKRPWIKIEGVKYHIRRQVDMAEGNFSRFNSLERRLREIDHPDKTVVTEQQLRIRREQAKELFYDVPPHEILRDVTAEQWDEIADFFCNIGKRKIGSSSSPWRKSKRRWKADKIGDRRLHHRPPDPHLPRHSPHGMAGNVPRPTQLLYNDDSRRQGDGIVAPRH